MRAVVPFKIRVASIRAQPKTPPSCELGLSWQVSMPCLFCMDDQQNNVHATQPSCCDSLWSSSPKMISEPAEPRRQPRTRRSVSLSLPHDRHDCEVATMEHSCMLPSSPLVSVASTVAKRRAVLKHSRASPRAFGCSLPFHDRAL